MAKSQRKITTFSLSFLDIMACGFGAVTLLFLILKHNPISTTQNDIGRTSEHNLLLEEIQTGKADLSRLKNTLDITNEDIAKIIKEIQIAKKTLAIEKNPEEELNALREKVYVLQEKVQRLKEQGDGKNIRQFLGDGERQYLTGLKLSGKRTIFLIDASASMLSDSIVNVIRFRNMDDESKKNSPKWKRTIKTTEWLISQLPKDGLYQIYIFNSVVESINNDDREWKKVEDLSSLNSTVRVLKEKVPNGGTNLTKAFEVLNKFQDPPDNIFLITDGLPTQGYKKKKNVLVSSNDRLELFQESLKELPSQTPVNILLFPMEGDPFAAANYWKLAISTKGSFMSPSRDWP
ncbi:MAG: hypothetical protein CMK44_06305 [Porticoccus sp.]|jgi:hypothetical protein|nr:hypothetical protein [Porticoccus sp.]